MDVTDFNRLVGNFDPLGASGFSSWRDGNFDGDTDVDINDFNHIATNFSPLGYPGDLTLPSITAKAATRPSTAGNTVTMSLETSSPDSASSRTSPIQQTGTHRIPWRTVGRRRVADSGEITNGVFQQQLDWESYDAFELAGKRTRRTLDGILEVRGGPVVSDVFPAAAFDTPFTSR